MVFKRKEIRVFHADKQYRYSSWIPNAVTVHSIEAADLVLFEGGADISPIIYKEEKHRSVYPDLGRDKREIEIWTEAQKLGKDSNYKFLSEQEEILFEKRIKDPEYVRKITEEIQRKEIINKKSPEELAIEAERIKEHNLRKDQRSTHGDNIRKALKSHIEEKYSNEDKNI